MKTNNIKFAFATAVCALAGSAIAQRKPTVTYTITGTPGDYTLDFNFTNNFNTGEGSLYFLGVLLDSGRDIAGSPTGWNPNQQTSWNNSSFGGSNLTYNNNWYDRTGTNIDPGQSLSGFEAISTDAIAPTFVNFFAYAIGGTYTGNDNFNGPTNPGFEGIATLQAVPAPSPLFALAPLAIGLVALRKRK